MPVRVPKPKPTCRRCLCRSISTAIDQALAFVPNTTAQIIHAALDAPGPLRGATCLAASDVAMLVSSYPDCLAGVAALPYAVPPICLDASRNIWAFRVFLTMLPAMSLFVALIVPAVYCIRRANQRQVRSLAGLIAKSIEVGNAQAHVSRRWHASSREVVPTSDRGGKPNGRTGAAARGVKENDERVQSMESLASRLRADLRSAEASRARQKKVAAKARAKASKTGTAAVPETSCWLAKPGEGRVDTSAAAGGTAIGGNNKRRAKRAAAKGGADRSGATLDELMAILTPESTKTWSMHRLTQQLAHGEEAQRSLSALSASLGAARLSQDAARALRDMIDDEDAAEVALAKQETVRLAELRALAESTFWHELAQAAPSLIDLLVTADDAMRAKLGRVLRAMCIVYMEAADDPERSPLVADHTHPRLLGLRFAPLVREVHRPLLLRFLTQTAAETDELRTREAVVIVRLRPPPFMGPPSKPPMGAMVGAPLRLTPLTQGASSQAEGGGSDGAGSDSSSPGRSLARPISMRPPSGAPRGEWMSAPRTPVPPNTMAPIRPATMLAPQQLAMLRQLLRRVAAATKEESAFSAPSKVSLLQDLSSVAKYALYGRSGKKAQRAGYRPGMDQPVGQGRAAHDLQDVVNKSDGKRGGGGFFNLGGSRFKGKSKSSNAPDISNADQSSGGGRNPKLATREPEKHARAELASLLDDGENDTNWFDAATSALPPATSDPGLHKALKTKARKAPKQRVKGAKA